MPRPIRVLVVDDDPVMLHLVKEWLPAPEFDVLTREDPVGTGAAIAKFRPDLLLLDVTMPSVSGDRLALVLTRMLPPSIAIALISLQEQPELDELARACGALGGIRKDVGAEAFLAGCRRFLTMKQQAPW